MDKKNELNLIDKYKLETIKKIARIPVNVEEIPEIVLNSWQDVFTISDATGNFAIGETAFPKPQMMGFFLETLIARQFEIKNKSMWLFDPTGYAKDITNLNDDSLSIEIKTSSSTGHIFGNRSYANPGATSKKSKNSFYLAINFENFNQKEIKKKQKIVIPQIKLIRFGYLKHEDWIGQKSSSGQQARLGAEVEKGKLIELWPNLDPVLNKLK